MKILVTGANGYLGKGVVKQLLDDGIEVIATDIKDNYIDKRATIIKGNLFEEDNPYDYFNQPDIVLHMAWRDGFIHNSLNHINDLPKHYEDIHPYFSYAQETEEFETEEETKKKKKLGRCEITIGETLVGASPF